VRLSALPVVAIVSGLPACALLDSIEDGGSLVNVFIAHHATPKDGEFPNYGTEGTRREFVNDQGWTVTLAEAYVTVAGVAVVGCSGSATEVDLYWGPCAEDFIDLEDAGPVGIGGVHVEPGNYCGMQVLHAPFDYEAAVMSGLGHDLPDNEAVDGATVYLRGVANKGEESVDFEWATDSELVIQLDISTLAEGGPMKIQHDEDFPHELTVGKPYDTFFEGIDFADWGPAYFEAVVMSSLEQDSRAYLGAGVDPAGAAP
jgi:hypothetical protein